MEQLSGDRRLGRFLLICGVAAGPFFYLLVLLQMATRKGFDITRHPISFLSLGSGGWVQIANFILTGLMAIACGVGIRLFLRGSRAGTWGPPLMAMYGLGMIIAGVFPADPSLGFPPGAPEGAPAELSSSASLHGVGFLLAFLSLTAVCFVFAGRFWSIGAKGWGLYSVATGASLLPIIALGMAFPAVTSIMFALAGVVGFGWVSAISIYLRATALQQN
jgi:hypothetical protein